MLIYRYHLFNCKATSGLEHFFVYFTFKREKKEIFFFFQVSSAKDCGRSLLRALFFWAVFLFVFHLLLLYLVCCHLMMPLSWQICREIVICDGWDVQQCTSHRNCALKVLNWDATALEGVAFISYSVATLFWDAVTSVMQGKCKKNERTYWKPPPSEMSICELLLQDVRRQKYLLSLFSHVVFVLASEKNSVLLDSQCISFCWIYNLWHLAYVHIKKILGCLFLHSWKDNSRF